jgi:rSAM/selenodomain-associated transferase 2
MAVSVIIPTLNEEGCIAETLRELRAQKPHEIIVSDGGSMDGTRRAAAGADCFLESQRGRAFQMNDGARRATGDVLLFLHADCRLEAGAFSAAEACLQRGRSVAGCFTMHVDASGALFRWIDFVAALRVRSTGLIYGDQGLFVRRELFDQLGGFPGVPILEDVHFSRTLRARGRVAITSKRIWVSPRRWRRTGIVRQTIRNWTILGLAAAGTPPHQLASWYPEVR